MLLSSLIDLGSVETTKEVLVRSPVFLCVAVYRNTLLVDDSYCILSGLLNDYSYTLKYL